MAKKSQLKKEIRIKYGAKWIKLFPRENFQDRDGNNVGTGYSIQMGLDDKVVSNFYPTVSLTDEKEEEVLEDILEGNLGNPKDWVDRNDARTARGSSSIYEDVLKPLSQTQRKATVS